MDNPEILEQIKQLHVLIGNGIKEVEKGENISFFKNMLQQNAIDLYQKAVLLAEKTPAKPAEIKIIRQEQVIEKVEVVEKTEIAETPKAIVEKSIEQPVQVIQPAELIEKEPAPIETAPKVEQAKPQVQVRQPQAEEEQELSLNERLSKQIKPVMNVSDKSKEMPIKDLVKSISIGKKFEFINGLFDGNADVYKSTLQTIQNASSYEEATQFLEANIVSPYEWQTNETLAAEFFGLTKRRFIQ